MKKSSSTFLKIDGGGIESLSKNKNLVKRVENNLKNFEMNSGSIKQQEFFKTKTMMGGGGLTSHGSGSAQQVASGSSKGSEDQKMQMPKHFESMTQNNSPIGSLLNFQGAPFKSSPLEKVGLINLAN